MGIIQLVFFLISVIGIVYSLKSKGLLQKIITSILFIAASLLWFPSTKLIFASLILALLASLLAIFYAFKVKSNTLIRLATGLFGLFLAYDFIGTLNHMVGMDLSRFLLVVPLALFVWLSLVQSKKPVKEYGFLLIFSYLSVTALLAAYLL